MTRTSFGLQSKFTALEGLPELSFDSPEMKRPLSDDDCYALWDKYAVPENIRRHSRLVAHIAQILAELALQRNIKLSIDEIRASALLHDLGKAYSLMYGGAHAALGAAWVAGETRNYTVAQGVLHHVYWPWKVREDASACQLPILVLYADKRVKHDQCVTLTERFQDLQVRYGTSDDARATIQSSLEQITAIETILSKVLGWEDLDAYSFTSRGMVY